MCTTELGRAAQLQDEFAKRNVKLCAVSVDLLKDHSSWTEDIQNVSGATLDYPLIEDRHRKISMMYGMLDQTSLDVGGGAVSITIRSVFIINPMKRVSLILTYPVPVGRNFGEILRAVDALRTNWEYGVATPADWRRGKPTVVLPFYSDDEAVSKFKKIDKKTSYLRFTPDPGAEEGPEADADAEATDGTETEAEAAGNTGEGKGGIPVVEEEDEEDESKYGEAAPAIANEEGIEQVVTAEVL